MHKRDVRPVRRRAASWGEGLADYVTLRRYWLKRLEESLMTGPFFDFPRLGPVTFRFGWMEPDMKRDPGGVRGGGTKLILDALVRSKALPQDTAAHVAGFAGDSFMYGGAVGVQVEAWTGQEPERPWFWAFAERLPDENEMLAARELGARRQMAAAARVRRGLVLR